MHVTYINWIFAKYYILLNFTVLFQLLKKLFYINPKIINSRMVKNNVIDKNELFFLNSKCKNYTCWKKTSI